MVGVCTLFEQELAEAPMSVKRGSVEIEIFAERGYGFATGEEEFYGADVAIVGAVLDQRDAVVIFGVGGDAFVEDVED